MGNVKLFFLLTVLSVISSAGVAGQSLVSNGGFEFEKDGRPDGWLALWMRDEGTGELAFDGEVRHERRYSIRVEHSGDKDWCVNFDRRVEVSVGDILELTCWIKIEGGGSVTPCVAAYDADGKAKDWSFGGRTVSGTQAWREVRSKFVVDEGTVTIVPRVIGNEAATVWVDDYALVKTGNVGDLRSGSLASELSVGNGLVVVNFSTEDGTLSVKDRRSGREWLQKPFANDKVVLDARKLGSTITAMLLDAASGLELKATFRLERSGELLVTLADEGAFDQRIQYPHPFVSEDGDRVVVPMNEGIGYPADDETIGSMRLVGYGGHGICMSFWGVDGRKGGYMAIIETPDDMQIRIDRLDGRLCVGSEWESQKGAFGYSRRLRYVFFDEGDHVEICKRYRSYVQERGTFKTMAQKLKENPNVDLLVGAVNVWCWDNDAVAIVKEMQTAGIERILWSNRKSPEQIEAMNAMDGVLTSRYDIYQDLMDPEVVKEQIRWVHPDWTQEAWPGDLMIDSRGKPINGWGVKGKDGKMYSCGVLCDRQAVEYAKKRVPAELKTHPYRSRFIDTTTASAWRECYDQDHPVTRGESRKWKMLLLEYMSKDMKLVTGSETGHDAAVPFVHYFEGMLSLGPYRVPDAGRTMQKIVDEVPERVAKFQVGQKYRLPLWELVYHDCVVAQWYWGDYNNKLPAIWKKRDLFNILYGTPPMFMFNRKVWNENRERFVKSYRDICPVVRSVGYQEMVEHRILTDDRNVQQTVFADGTKITVNFGDKPWHMLNGDIIEALGFVVSD